MARGIDKKSNPAVGVSVTGVAAAGVTHATTQAMGCAPVPGTAATALQAGQVVLGTGMNPDLRLLGGEAV